jgi:VanZ family protein
VTGAAEGEAAAARRARILLLTFAAFVVYGSFFPFSFHVDPVEVQRDLARFWGTLTLFDPNGRRLFSRADLLSNVLLGVPVGVLLVRGGLVGRSLVARVAGALGVETVFAGVVEVGQILAPTRTASALDVLAQTAGAVIGALAAHALGAGAARGIERWLATALRARPSLVVVTAVAVLLAADALYPYALTLDVSTAWGNLKRAQWVPLASFRRRFWGDLLVDRLLPYAAMTVAGRLALGGPPERPGGGIAGVALVWLLATLWASALEVGKLLIVGRAPNVDNVILAAAGGLLGLVALTPLAGSSGARKRGAVRLAWLTGAVLAYRELSPFDWLGSADRIAARAARIEWIPLASYFYADPQSALFDLGTKVAWSGFFGASLRAAGVRAPWRWALALGVALEMLQLLQASHVPAVTDALAIGAGAALGTRALDVYRRWRGHTTVSIARH